MNKHAFIFPGQGAQFSGMGKTLFANNPKARAVIEDANQILDFDIALTMFEGTDEDLKQTNITQVAVFIHSIAAFSSIENVVPDIVAGHSLGEFSALVAAGVLSFADALRLVALRAGAMQKACMLNPSSMAAILGIDDEKVELICKQVSEETGEVVVAANYNCPGQLVISGSVRGLETACERLKAAGAKRALLLPVGGAFHSPLMVPAKEELSAAINETAFEEAVCPVYQNVTAAPVMNPVEIKENLIAQLTGPVKWTQTVQAMIADGGSEFTECGPGKVLQGLVLKIDKNVITNGVG